MFEVVDGYALRQQLKDFKDLPPLPTIAGSAKGEARTPRRLRCPGGRKSKEKQDGCQGEKGKE